MIREWHTVDCPALTDPPDEDSTRGSWPWAAFPACQMALQNLARSPFGGGEGVEPNEAAGALISGNQDACSSSGPTDVAQGHRPRPPAVQRHQVTHMTSKFIGLFDDLDERGRIRLFTVEGVVGGCVSVAG